MIVKFNKLKVGKKYKVEGFTFLIQECPKCEKKCIMRKFKKATYKYDEFGELMKILYKYITECTHKISVLNHGIQPFDLRDIHEIKDLYVKNTEWSL